MKQTLTQRVKRIESEIDKLKGYMNYTMSCHEEAFHLQTYTAQASTGEISLCKSCMCMTKTICGKCKKNK